MSWKSSQHDHSNIEGLMENYVLRKNTLPCLFFAAVSVEIRFRLCIKIIYYQKFKFGSLVTPKSSRWSYGFTNNFVNKTTKENMKISKHLTILSITSVKIWQKSLYDSGCYLRSVILAEHRKQDYISKPKKFLKKIK